MNPFPQTSLVDGIAVDAFPDTQALFQRILHEIDRPGSSIVGYVNVHVANTAFRLPELKAFLRRASVVYCDGAGIVWGSRLLGEPPLPTRLTAADWLFELWDVLAQANKTVYFLGGSPGVAERAVGRYLQQQQTEQATARPCPVVGVHHGYIGQNPELEASVLQEIERLKPDVLFVGMGTPAQERWILKNRQRLNVPVIYPIGAVADFLAGEVSRCPAWMGAVGLEWLYRLWVEPKRMFGRYVVGNPWFLARISLQALQRHWLPTPAPKPTQTLG
ncbi:MAG: WecB/TagA/CpsF family glycosyltransferase [Candidatus Melainabacteria bacterium]|nr:WecB/TagA/CpsF family glycosyltransferase [Candidatus Melainabacteria bacterium]